jgi:Cation efflux family
VQVPHAGMRRGGLRVWREPCYSFWLHLSQVTSVTSLLGYSETQPTFLGIGILVAAAVVMPWLAREKRLLSGATGSAALRADAAQSALCAYLSLIALAGLAINAIWRVKWADPIAALAILPLIVWEGREAMRGKTCGCCLSSTSSRCLKPLWSLPSGAHQSGSAGTHEPPAMLSDSLLQS